jgi:hypothetical protein
MPSNHENTKRHFRPLASDFTKEKHVSKRDAVCKLSHHYLSGTRRIVARWEHLASLNPFGFVFETTKRTAENCFRYVEDGRGEPYHVRMVEYVKQLLQEQGFATDGFTMKIDGVERYGFRLAEHDAFVVERLPHTCKIEPCLGWTPMRMTFEPTPEVIERVRASGIKKRSYQR